MFSNSLQFGIVDQAKFDETEAPEILEQEPIPSFMLPFYDDGVMKVNIYKFLGIAYELDDLNTPTLNTQCKKIALKKLVELHPDRNPPGLSQEDIANRLQTFYMIQYIAPLTKDTEKLAIYNKFLLQDKVDDHEKFQHEFQKFMEIAKAQPEPEHNLEWLQDDIPIPLIMENEMNADEIKQRKLELKNLIEQRQNEMEQQKNDLKYESDQFPCEKTAGTEEERQAIFNSMMAERFDGPEINEYLQKVNEARVNFLSADLKYNPDAFITDEEEAAMLNMQKHNPFPEMEHDAMGYDPLADEFSFLNISNQQYHKNIKHQEITHPLAQSNYYKQLGFDPTAYSITETSTSRTRQRAITELESAPDDNNADDQFTV